MVFRLVTLLILLFGITTLTFGERMSDTSVQGDHPSLISHVDTHDQAAPADSNHEDCSKEHQNCHQCQVCYCQFIAASGFSTRAPSYNFIRYSSIEAFFKNADQSGLTRPPNS